MSKKTKADLEQENELLRNFIIDVFAEIFYHKDEPEHIDPNLIQKLVNLHKAYGYDEVGWPDFVDREYAEDIINQVRHSLGYREYVKL